MRNFRLIHSIVMLTIFLFYLMAVRTCVITIKEQSSHSRWEDAYSLLHRSFVATDAPSRIQRLPSITTRKKLYDPKIFDIDMVNYTGPARAFPRWTRPFPCFPVPANLMSLEPSQRGLLFQRPVKTGSTTLAGTIMRIAHRQARRQEPEEQLQQPSNLFSSIAKLIPTSTTTTAAAATFVSSQQRNYLCCDHRANHGSAVNYQYAHRDRNQSFLLSLVRNPTRRIISHFFHFGVAGHRQEPTDANFEAHLWSQLARNDLLQDVSLYPIHEIKGGPSVNYTQVVEDVIQGYDFIALLERFDESMVALKMLLNLDFEDILYVQERSEGTFSNGPADRPCMYIPRSFITPHMKSLLTCDAWLEHNKGDRLLYRAVHKSLDLTIDQLGRDEFQRQLSFFRKINQRAQEWCAPRSVSICSDGGLLTPEENRTCYIWAEGCSHACLDEIQIQETMAP